MPITLLGPDTPFPAAERALRDPDGLLAVGGDLGIPRLAAAYAGGIFPWYSGGEPILWWSPDPRMVLRTAAFRPGHALAKKLRRIERGALPVEVRVNTAFREVITACAGERAGQPGTWIGSDIIEAYVKWHAAGGVHSIETWMDGRLAGGLYGIGMGAMFFGESMFTRVTDASKIALAHLVAFLRRHGVELIDCQQDTAHLARLGGATMPRAEFLAHVRASILQAPPPWARGRLRLSGEIEA